MYQRNIPKKTNKKLLLGLVLLAVAAAWLLTGKRDSIRWSVTDSALLLTYSEGGSITAPFSEIESVTLQPGWEAGTKISGAETSVCRFGEWKNAALGTYRAALYSRVEPCVVIELPGGTLVMNADSADATDEFYRAFTALVAEKQRT